MTKSDELICHNKYGQIGCKVTKNQTIPIRIEGFNVKKVESIACGGLHTLALTDAGHVYSWGCDDYGQLGLEIMVIEIFRHK